MLRNATDVLAGEAQEIGGKARCLRSPFASRWFLRYRCVMSFLGVNPRHNERLDQLRRNEVNLLGIPAPISAYATPVAGGPSPSAGVSQDLAQELRRGRRGEGAGLFEDAIERLAALRESMMGTTQPGIMLQFGEKLFVAFVADAMSPDELRAFGTFWRIRGLIPASIQARRQRFWQYELTSDWRPADGGQPEARD